MAALAGCARPGRGFALLAPGSAQRSVTMTQQISIVKGASRFETLAVVEISSRALTLASLGPLGGRVMALSWDGSALTKELDPSVPGQLPVEDILRSVQLVYWPQESLRRALKRGWELTLEPGRRGLTFRGKEVIAVRYGGDQFDGPIEVEDKAAGYTTIIKTLESSHE